MNAIVDNHAGITTPKMGDRFQCSQCGMQIQVTKDCQCGKEEHVHFHCCGREMEKT